MIGSWLILGAALCIIVLSAKITATTVVGRIVSLIAVMLGTTLVVSGSMHLVPGDPVDHILGDQAIGTSKDLLRRELGLIDQDGRTLSFVEQYAQFLGAVATFEIKSFITRRNAFTVVAERLPYTIALASAAMVVALLLGPLLGIFASFFHLRWPDHALSFLALTGISVPSFFLGPLLLLFFAIKLQLLPISGADDGIMSVILPAIAMGTALAAMLARMSRASMLESLSEDYIRTAHAKGLAPHVVFVKHALRNALIPVTTVVGLQFGAVLAGSVVTEKIFNWPGIGLLLLESIQNLDLPLVQVCVLVIAFIYAVINMLTDMAYSFIDPRMIIGVKKS